MSRRRDAAAGLTLIEVLIVLAIVGVMAGATMLGLGGLGRDARGAAEASRLADRLQLAADDVLVASAPLVFVWNGSTYQFLAWDRAGGVWRPSTQADLGVRRALPSGLTLTADGDTPRPLLITQDLPQPAVTLTITDGSGSWRVAFDGIAASAGEAATDAIQ